MKLDDIITCVASWATISVLISLPLSIALLPALGFYNGQNVSAIITVFLSALITGVIFAPKIQEESRKEAIAKVTVLFALVMMVSVTLNAAVYADWTKMVKDAYLEANPGATYSTLEWYVITTNILSQIVVLNVVIVLVLGFIGLYIGSMLKKTPKT